MTCLSRSLLLKVGITPIFFLENYTLSTYNDVVSYVIYVNQKYDIYMVVISERFHKV